jgi:hypothetical protein
MVVPEWIVARQWLIQFVGLKNKKQQIPTKRDRKTLSLTEKSSRWTIEDIVKLSRFYLLTL